MNLQKAKEYISEVGQWLAGEATVVGNERIDWEEPIMGCIMVKRALTRLEEQIQKEEFQKLERQFRDKQAEVMFGARTPQHCTFKPDNPRDSGTVSAPSGVDVGDSGTCTLPGEAQAHD